MQSVYQNMPLLASTAATNQQKGNTTLQRIYKLPIEVHLVSRLTQQVRVQIGFCPSTRFLPARALTWERVTGQLPAGVKSHRNNCVSLAAITLK